MKKSLLFALVFVLLLAVSCGPAKYAVQVEMRYPSKVGVDLTGKQVSVISLEGSNPYASAFSEAVASGFASEIEKEYNFGEGSVGVYRMRLAQGGVYSSRDSLVNLLMDTGADAVFLLDTISLGTMTVSGATGVASPPSADSAFVSTANVSYSFRMYHFDAMDESETVKTYAGNSYAKPDVYSNGRENSSVLMQRAYSALEEEGGEVGAFIASSFSPIWKHEQYSITYFEGEKWLIALAKAGDYDWKGAMDIWLDLLESGNVLRRSCAQYNIATACLMLGDAKLASQWLDLSDENAKLPVSDVLRKRIDARLK